MITPLVLLTSVALAAVPGELSTKPAPRHFLLFPQSGQQLAFPSLEACMEAQAKAAPAWTVCITHVE